MILKIDPKFDTALPLNLRLEGNYIHIQDKLLGHRKSGREFVRFQLLLLGYAREVINAAMKEVK